jgi:hypothetical protein
MYDCSVDGEYQHDLNAVILIEKTTEIAVIPPISGGC